MRWANGDPATRAQYALEAHARIRRSYGEPEQPLVFETLPQDISGGFDTASGEVLVDPDVLLHGDPVELLETLAHENRHALQDRRIREARTDGLEAPDAEVRIWDQAERSYAADDHLQYRYNALEVDARDADVELERGFLRRHIELLSAKETPRTVTRSASRGQPARRRPVRQAGLERG